MRSAHAGFLNAFGAPPESLALQAILGALYMLRGTIVIRGGMATFIVFILVAH